MNNKSDKKPKPKHKPKHKKKTPSQSKKKKEIKGGVWPFSRNKKETSTNESELENLLSQNPSNSNKLDASASKNVQPQQPEIPNIQPNAKPQGINTLKAQSRCSIM
jgi:hypothetical protein